MTELGVDPLAEEVAALGCAALVDAMGRLFGHRAHLLPLVSPDPGRPAFGRAVTISYLPPREDVTTPTFAEALTEALASAAPGRRVLVMSSGGYRDASHGGGVKLARAEGQVAAVLVDGRLRDFDQLRSYGFATWCRGEAVQWGGGTVTPYAANVAVEFGGVCVLPGDYVYADAAGGVVIPADRIDDVLEAAREVDREDAAGLAEIRREQLSRDLGS